MDITTPGRDPRVPHLGALTELRHGLCRKLPYTLTTDPEDGTDGLQT